MRNTSVTLSRRKFLTSCGAVAAAMGPAAGRVGAALSRSSLLIGHGQVDLQPPLGGSMAGYFNDRLASGTLDPIRAQAIYVECGTERGALVSLDLIFLSAPEVAACRAAVARATGIPLRHVWLHATHTHTGPCVPRRFTSDADSIFPGLFPGKADPGWTAALPDRIANAVRAAQSAARPTSAQLAQRQVESLAFYRRFRMKDGTITTNPGRGNPNIAAPVGTVDPTLTVVRFPESRALVLIFGLHPDTLGGTRYSADYPAHLTTRVQEQLGSDWNVLFLNAACGNINHIDVHNPRQGGGPAESVRIGRALGEATLRALDAAEPLTIDTIGFASEVVSSRLRTVPEQEVREAERLLREEPAKSKSFNGMFAPAALVLGKTKDRAQDAEIAALRLGPIGLAAMPGEFFVELAREVQHDSPFHPTRVIGLTNGALGYIPYADAYKEGGYEAGYRSARFEPTTGHRWAQTAVRLLKDLKDRG